MTPLFTLLLRHQIYVHSVSMVASHILSMRQVCWLYLQNIAVQPFFTTCCYLQPVLQLSLLLCAACVRAKPLQSCPTLWPYGPYPTRLLCLWDSPGKNTGVSCHTLLQGNLPDPGSNPYPSVSRIGRWVLYRGAIREAPLCASFPLNWSSMPASLWSIHIVARVIKKKKWLQYSVENPPVTSFLKRWEIIYITPFWSIQFTGF